MNKKTTYFETLMHFCKGVMGAGIFSMGIAFRNAGMITALIFTPIIGGIVLHCIYMLIDSINYITIKEHSKPNKNINNDEEDDDDYEDDYKEVSIDEYTNKLDFASLVENILSNGPPFINKISKYIKTIVNIFICIMYIGFCCLYVVFVATNMKQVLSSFNIFIDVRIMMLLAIIPMWAISMIPNLKTLSPVSTIGNFLMLSGYITTMVYVCTDIPNFSNVELFGELVEIPQFFGVALFAFEGIALIMPLRNEMKKPNLLIHKFGVLNVGFLITTTLITLMGTLSYLKYGSSIEQTIFLSLPGDDIVVRGLLIIICIQVILTYPLQLYVPVSIVWPMIAHKFKPTSKYLTNELIFRTCLVFLTLIIGESIPFVNLIISLVGAVCSTSLTLFFPPLLNTIIYYKKETPARTRLYVLIKNILIIVIAVVIFITGLYSTINDIIATF